MFDLLLAAHEGEELVIALPAVMLGAALILLKWAAGNSKDDEEDEDLEQVPAPQPLKLR